MSAVAAPALSLRLAQLVRAIGPIWLVLAAALVLAPIIAPRFFTPANLTSVLQLGVVTGIVALGMTVVLIGGHYDLSVGAIVMMAAVAALKLDPVDGAHTALAIVAPLALGGLIGLGNGVCIASAGANSIVATIAMQFMLTGAVLAFVGGAHVTAAGLSDPFWALSNARLAGVPLSVFLFAALVAIVAVVMRQTVFGRHLYAIGGDVEAARRAGVPVVARSIASFIVSGVLAAIAGVLIASRVGHLDPTGIARYEFPALTAAILGGVSLSGGVGRPLDTAGAILVVAVMTNVMTLMNVAYSSQLLVQGLVLTGAMAFYAWQRGEP